jgi:hypothetical protein
MQSSHNETAAVLDPIDRPLWGVKAIAKAINTDERKCWHLIRIGQLPVKRAGGRVFSTLRALQSHFVVPVK